MAVLLNTSLGDIVIDLHTELCPLTTKNFLKLCKIKYYNNCLFHSVQKDFIVQTGDPTGSGSGGESIYKFLYGDQARFFDDEAHPKLKHDKLGTVAMASAGENLNASQFYITTRAGLDYLDGKHTVFGELAEGSDTLMRINEAYVDEKGRPYKNIRIKHTYVLDDPFDDPIQLSELIPDGSPELKPPAEGEEVRLEDDWVPMDEQQDPEELEKSLRRKEAHSRAVVLEMVGDIPEAEIKPPENVLFICKLNPVTQEEDLEIIFSRFGKIISADIIRDFKTGDSLCYGFIEFETNEACEAAYFKMDNVLIDDRRIHVDFSQSVARLWTRYRRYGNKDTGGGEGANFAPQAKGGGCFNCGEVGHFAKDCPNDHLKETLGVQEKPKYKLKDTGGQHGDTNKKYEMLFDEGSIDSAGKHVVVQKKEEVARKQKVERSSRREGNLDDNRRILPLKRSPENNLEGKRQRSTRRYGEEDRNNFADGRNNKYGWSRGGKDDGLERNRDRHREKHYSEEKWTEQYRGRHREEREGHSPQKGHRHDGREDEKVRRQGRDGRQGIEDYSRDSKSGMSHDRHKGFEQEERINQAVRDDRYEIDRKYNKYREDEREARGELRKFDNNHSYKDYNEEKMDKKHEKHRAGKREEKQ